MKDIEQNGKGGESQEVVRQQMQIHRARRLSSTPTPNQSSDFRAAFRARPMLQLLLSVVKDRPTPRVAADAVLPPFPRHEKVHPHLSHIQDQLQLTLLVRHHHEMKNLSFIPRKTEIVRERKVFLNTYTSSAMEGMYISLGFFDCLYTEGAYTAWDKQ